MPYPCRRVGIRFSLPDKSAVRTIALPDGSILIVPTGSTYKLCAQLEAVELAGAPSASEPYNPEALDTRIVAVRPYNTSKRTLLIKKKEEDAL